MECCRNAILLYNTIDVEEVQYSKAEQQKRVKVACASAGDCLLFMVGMLGCGIMGGKCV